MWVKYVGQGELNFEFNGKRFFFSRNTAPKEIPSQVYDYVKAAKTVESDGLVPCEAPGTQAGAPGEDWKAKYEAEKDRADKLEKENEKLTKRVESLESASTNAKPGGKGKKG